MSKINLPIAELKPALAGLGKIIQKRTTLPVLSCIRIDRINTDAGARTISYHFLNDELRVQEGIQERSIEQFLADGWYMAAPGKSL